MNFNNLIKKQNKLLMLIFNDLKSVLIHFGAL